MKRPMVWLFFGVIGAALCFYVGRRVTTGALAHANINVVPFLLQTETYNFDSNPEGKLIQKRTVARRSDGATANISTVGLVEWDKTTRKVSYLNGVWATVYDIIAAKTTWRLQPREVAALKDRLQNPPPNCVFDTEGNPAFLRDETVLGHPAAVVQSVTDIARTTSWRARDLGCEDLQYRYETVQPDGSFKLRSEEKAVTLRLKEPSAALFDIGANVVEMKPSEAHRLYFEKLPIPEDEATKKMSEHMDQKYLSQPH